MAVTKNHFRLAVQNIAKFGDTDVFPFPIENHVFFDRENEVVDVLAGIDKDFDDAILNILPCLSRA